MRRSTSSSLPSERSNRFSGADGSAIFDRTAFDRSAACSRGVERLVHTDQPRFVGVDDRAVLVPDLDPRHRRRIEHVMPNRGSHFADGGDIAVEQGSVTAGWMRSCARPRVLACRSMTASRSPAACPATAVAAPTSRSTTMPIATNHPTKRATVFEPPAFRLPSLTAHDRVQNPKVSAGVASLKWVRGSNTSMLAVIPM